MKKIVVLILVISLTFWTCASAFATPTSNLILSNFSTIASIQDTSSGVSNGLIGTYHPLNPTSNTYQPKNNLQLSLDYELGEHGGPGGGGHGGMGPGPDFGPDLWVYTLIGIVVVGLLSH